jgi:serine/threonine-protein kinase
MTAPLTEPSLLGTLLAGRYEIRAPLGEGGMGQVFEAVDRRLGRTVAIKVLRPELAADATFLARFRREAATAARLAHAGIVSVHDIGEDAGRTFIVMELVPGRTVAELGAGRTPEAPAIARLGAAAARALGHAHDRGVVHRDVSPGNVMVTPDGAVKILDFGIARGPSAGLEASAASRGTLPYLAPEVLRGDRPDPRADIYALGAVLIELSAGLDDDELRRVLDRATMPDPGRRYVTAGAFADALDELHDEGGADTAPPAARDRGATAPIVRMATRPIGSAAPAPLTPTHGTPVRARGVAAHAKPRPRRTGRIAIGALATVVAMGGALVLAEVLTSISSPQAIAEVRAPEAVPRPEGLVATASCDGLFATGVDLVWDGTGPSKGYEVWRGTGDGARELVARIRGVHHTALRDVDLGVDTTYTYRVRAFDGPRVSEWSTVAEVSTPFLCLT